MTVCVCVCAFVAFVSLLSGLIVLAHTCSTHCFHCVCVSVCVGSPADGILFPGDQVLQINDTVLEDLSTEQVENIIR